MSAPLVLALDSGTQSSRAIAFDTAGRIVAQSAHTHPELTVLPGGGVQQRPDDVWGALRAALEAVCAELGGQRSQVVALALTTQRHTIVPAAADGTPLSPAIHWLDRRTGTPAGRWLRLAARVPPVGSILSVSRGHVLQTIDPDLYDRTERLLPLSSWLTHQLTGEFADTPGSFPGLWPIDPRRGTVDRNDLQARLLAIPRRWLPRLVPAGAELGRLRPELAAALGLPELPLFAVGGDKQAEALGGGLTTRRADAAAVSLGTGAAVAIPLVRFDRDLSGALLTIAAAEPGSWCQEYLVYRGLWLVSWLLREVMPGETIEGLEERARSVAPGSEGLSCLPRWVPLPMQGHERGGLVGFHEAHGRGHIYRAILEGICFDLRRGLELLESRSGRSIRTLHVGGGGSRSRWLVQMLADICGRPVHLGRTPELSALGAAVVAAVGAGLHSDLAAAVAAMTGGGERLEPQAEVQQVYQRIYRRSWLPRLVGWSELLRPRRLL